jgi:Glycosyltransferase family 87
MWVQLTLLAGKVPRTSRVWLSLALGMLLVPLAAAFLKRAEPLGLDFHTYAAAARVGLQYGWSHIYDQELVATAQTSLAPNQATQPFLSPPPVAWLAALLAGLPYAWAFGVWAIVTTFALAWAVAWSAPASRGGLERWLAAALVVAPAWVLVAARVGQVVPLVAVGVLVAWRLLREDRDLGAGVVLALLLLKPNTAFLVPLALLAAGRRRTFVTWLIAASAVAVAVFATVGVEGLAAYVSQLQNPPPGTNALSLEATLGVSGLSALVFRVAIIGAVLVAAWRLRTSTGLVIVLGVIGSLLVSPYLHASDLTLFAVAGWIVWAERPMLTWRAPLAASWLIASPFVSGPLRPTQARWPLLELTWLLVLVVVAWRLDRPFPASVDGSRLTNRSSEPQHLGRR